MSNNDDIDILRDAKTARESSFDTTGANRDFRVIQPGSSAVLADIKGPGRITHIWMTQRQHYRDCLLRITWDDAAGPSVLCPLGDFFCLGHSMVNSFQSALFAASTRFDYRFDAGCALNCYAPMHFRKRALVELVNESDEEHLQYFYVDYETYGAAETQALRRGYFHAEFRRCNPFGGWGNHHSNGDVNQFRNAGRCAWENNYVILDARGRGHYVGCNLSVTNLRGDWWGEGDDMIWVDGYKWPPDLHGTGSEDFFNQAWGMNECAHWRNGSSVWEGRSSGDSRYGGAAAAYSVAVVGGYQTCYLFHVENPIRFEREIKVTLEAGHANHQANDYASVAYWYAQEPGPAAAPPPAPRRRPILRDNKGRWIIDPETLCPGPPVAENEEFRKAKTEYDARAEKQGLLPLTTSIPEACRQATL